MLWSLLSVAYASSLAAPPDYSGPIDSFSGAPKGDTAGAFGGSYVYIGYNVAYDREKQMFSHAAGSQPVYANVSSDTITAQPVSIQLPEDMVYVLYRDGKAVSDIDLSNITEPGVYILQQVMLGQAQEIMRFTVLNSVTGRLQVYTVPTGFAITSALLDGQPVQHKASSVDLEQEGTYQITYQCPALNTVYTESFTVDHTPPVLALDDVVDGVAKGPVDISDLEDGAAISIRLNGKEMPDTQVLTGSGNYQLSINDEAGNLSEYQFRIQVYFNSNGLIFFAALLALIVGIGIYVFYTERHQRIR